MPSVTNAHASHLIDPARLTLADGSPLKHPALLDIDRLIETIPLADKVKLLSGGDFWHLASLPGFGIPSVRTSDGPNGVRGQYFFNGTPASCFPSATGLAASFDPVLVEEVGTMLGHECRAKGAHVLLGPTVNMQRSPLAGRGFESFSEDPLLSGTLAGAYMKGVQSTGVAACIKHLVGNEQEHERFSSNSVIGPRALREIYLEPFRVAMKIVEPVVVMTAYPKLNGVHCSDDKWLLQDTLRDEWGFKGAVMSDWTGTYSVGKSLRAGTDIEMPGPPVMRGAAVLRKIHGGRYSIDELNTRVRKVLELVNHAIASGIPFNAEEQELHSPELSAVMRRAAADAIVLLKNNTSLLPLSRTSPPRSIAIIGLNAKVAFPSGGGSASLSCSYKVSPLEGIAAALAGTDTTISYAIGSATFRYLPPLDASMRHPVNGNSGTARVQFWKTNPAAEEWLGPVVSGGRLRQADHECATMSSVAPMLDHVPYETLGENVFCRFTADFTPDTDGVWDVDLVTIGYGMLYVDGKSVIDNVSKFQMGSLWFNNGSKVATGSINFQKGKTYLFEVRTERNHAVLSQGPFLARCAIRLGAFPRTAPLEAIAEAVGLAHRSELAICVVGTSHDWEGEGADRETLELPGTTHEMVAAVLDANPNTIVVTQSGMPLSMPWITKASTVVHAFFGGNEVGSGLADVLFGVVNPSAKLPLTFPKRLQDNPTFNSFASRVETPGQVLYGEGIFMGYKHYDKSKIEPLFPFGHGLSYTTFSLSNLKTSSPLTAYETCLASVLVTNTGDTFGHEVVQLYITLPADVGVARPVRVLKGFQKVALQAGDSALVEIALTRDAFSFWSEAASAWIVRKGRYLISVGRSSRDLEMLSVEVDIELELQWRGL